MLISIVYFLLLLYKWISILFCVLQNEIAKFKIISLLHLRCLPNFCLVFPFKSLLT